ncbi:alcohol dehydrogenase catalytic domain-containing protein [Conexibacter sp. JD483]|uniref:zinc-dependent alcohol dehydrogenase n=1 Tax=unclassified Conexibacter TaxID=2627773 RepID=UPI002721C311|nr:MULTISPECIES: alcohol dehydrogenase catalytic domain-containing protein [unclassified Conexibacter]MDO8187832.1 alcohol dehydrogenase catalytic domain-containing protein [Conexibacter sp. CPCC 205706]MDO8199959.1 alcohol dehydrogenase catalytic domain-containing protein [Conexibacter sp. CPCC 205762]MDR9369486.1 alcohol dehydrogenase catalytic domain-containing protein [Conexibacter sp. JD483]
MLALVYSGAGALAVETTAAPLPDPGEVRVRVHSCGICMSDVYGVAGVNERRDAVLGAGETLVMGHEVVGVVDDLGAGVAGVARGALVAVDPICGCGRCARCAAGEENACARRTIRGCVPAAPGGYAEALAVPARKLHPLPPGTAPELGALAEPLAVGAHGVALADPPAGGAALVIGGGIVGIGAALAARRRLGAGAEIVVAEPRAHRRALCEQLGLVAATPQQALAHEQRFELVLDCVARPETFAGAVRAARRGGEIVLVGIWQDEIPLPVSEVVARESRIRGSFGYTHADFAGVVAWLGDGGGRDELLALVEHRVGFDGLIAALRGHADGSLTAVRTLFHPDLDLERT